MANNVPVHFVTPCQRHRPPGYRVEGWLVCQSTINEIAHAFPQCQRSVHIKAAKPVRHTEHIDVAIAHLAEQRNQALANHTPNTQQNGEQQRPASLIGHGKPQEERGEENQRQQARALISESTEQVYQRKGDQRLDHGRRITGGLTGGHRHHALDHAHQRNVRDAHECEYQEEPGEHPPGLASEERVRVTERLGVDMVGVTQGRDDRAKQSKPEKTAFVKCIHYPPGCITVRDDEQLRRKAYIKVWTYGCSMRDEARTWPAKQRLAAPARSSRRFYATFLRVHPGISVSQQGVGVIT